METKLVKHQTDKYALQMQAANLKTWGRKFSIQKLWESNIHSMWCCPCCGACKKIVSSISVFDNKSLLKSKKIKKIALSQNAMYDKNILIYMWTLTDSMLRFAVMHRVEHKAKLSTLCMNASVTDPLVCVILLPVTFQQKVTQLWWEGAIWVWLKLIWDGKLHHLA